MNSAAHKILIVDDNTAIHQDIKKILASVAQKDDAFARMDLELFGGDADIANRDSEFIVDSALQGKQGFEMVKSAAESGSPYRVAFVDVRMPPGWDGVQTIEEMWRVDEALQVILCTAYSDHSWREIAKRLERADGWLILKKPFDSMEVLQLAHALSGKWQLGRQARSHLQDLERTVAERTRELSATNEKLARENEERRIAETNLRHLATHDALTGLANRSLLHDRLEMSLARAQRYKTLVGVMLLDLNEFKAVNDTYGHEAGDELLRIVASRLKKVARKSDTVARLGGDEFVLVLPDLQSASDGSIVAARILEALKPPVAFGQRSLNASGSLGLAMYPRDSEDRDGLLKCADLAMYHAKESDGPTYAEYVPGLVGSGTGRLSLGDDLQKALAHRELVIKYTPVVSLEEDQGLVALDAKLGWQHPILGDLRWPDFSDVAGSPLLGEACLRWALYEVGRQNAERKGVGCRDVPIIVPLLTTNLTAQALRGLLEGARDRGNLPLDQIWLSVEAPALVRDIESSIDTLAPVADLGLRLIIEHFEFGPTSLRAINLLQKSMANARPPLLKITVENGDPAVVRSLASMAAALGVQILATGVDTPEQLATLRHMPSSPTPSPRWQGVQGRVAGEDLSGDQIVGLLKGP